MPRKPVRATFGVAATVQEYQPGSSPTFERLLTAAMAAAPADPREGHGPSETRPMPRHKVLAAWLHCTRLPLGEIARGATIFSGTKVSYSIVGKWRTEAAFQALVEKAQTEIVEALTKQYEESWDHTSYAQPADEAFERFRTELSTYNLWIRVHVAINAKNAADRAEKECNEFVTEVKARHTKGKKVDVEAVNKRLEAVQNGKSRRGHEWCSLVGDDAEIHSLLGTREEWRRAAIEHGLTVTRIVETYRRLFAEAVAEKNWTHAQEAFDRLTDIAGRFARQADEKRRAAVAREDAKVTASNKKKTTKKSKPNKRSIDGRVSMT